MPVDTVNGKRLRTLAIALGASLALYALIGFLVLPAVLKHQLVQYVEQDLGHKLAIGDIRINPFTLTAAATEIELREPSGAALLGCKALFADFEARSVLRRSFAFSEISLTAPLLHAELRPDGSSNFTALFERLRKPPPQPESALPRLEVGHISISDARIELADLQAGEHARLRLAPIKIELTAVSTLPQQRFPYKLAARTTEGETIQWEGDVALAPFSTTGTLALQGWKVATLARLLGNRVALQGAGGELDVAFGYTAAYAKGEARLRIDTGKLSLADFAVTPRGAAMPLANVQRLAVDFGLDSTQRTLTLTRVTLSGASAGLEIDAAGKGNWAALALRPMATAPTASAAPVAATPSEPATGAGVAPPAAAPWRVQLGDLAASEIALKLTDRRADSALDVTLERARLALSGSMALGAAALQGSLADVAFAAAALRLARADERATFEQLQLGSPRIDVQLGAAASEVAASALKISSAAASITQGSRALRHAGASFGAHSVALSVNAQSAPVRIDIQAPSLEWTGLAAHTQTAKAFAALERVQASASAIVVANAAVPEVRGEGLKLGIESLVLRDPASGTPLARLARVEASGGMLSSLERTASLDSLLLIGGNAAASISGDGKSSWDALLALFGLPAAAGGKPKTAPAPVTPPWNVAAKSIELRELGVDFSDQRHEPAISIVLQDAAAQIRNAGTVRGTPATVTLRGRIKDGGEFALAGSVDPHTLAADLKVKAADLSLLPARHLLAQHARLRLVSALASVDGRLRYGKAKEAGADVVFEGELGLAKLLVEETEPAQPFLSVGSLRASQMKLTLEPDGLDIPDLRIDALATKLVIEADQSINIGKVLRPKAAAGPPPAPGTPADDAAGDGFPISLARIRIDNSVLEFADLSLRPQFSTRMHELQGVITGVSTSRATRARVELEARVDEFGSVQIQGALNLFSPRSFTDVTLDFRNIEMTALTPYAAKFAGYRIASGSLSMDLHYRVKNSALIGENKIVVDKLELGERVESPSALDLPLELAIALLKDENGRIDIGLPVTGNLDDPQFSVAALVWKAVGNLLTRIVTAPFRALASLFGAGSDGEKLDAIEFDPGMDRLRPPQRQKLRTVAEALQKRPQLALEVKPAYSPAADRPALQSIAARRSVLSGAGIKLEPGESPGPLDFANDRIQRSLESLFAERFGAPAARELRSNLAKPPPAAPAEGAKPPVNPALLASIRLARAMSQQLIAAQAVTDEELMALAQRRGAAIAQELSQAGKVDRDRLSTAAPHAVAADADGPVPSDLDLALVK
ncbi:MAG: DUF748 domain-containing protein [Burkholderiales bacterium]|nr:DUF748 domain-containing protein [Burkholderiales bacterium]